MMRFVKIALLSVKYVWVLGLLAGFAVAIGFVPIPGVTAQQVECSGQVISGECLTEETETEGEVDVCWNLPKAQASLPRGYIYDQENDNACVEDSSLQEVQLKSANTPQVLADTNSTEILGK